MSQTEPIHVSKIQSLFHEAFFETYRVELLSGTPEPFYRAAKTRDEINQIFSRSDFIRSALHEIAHWCVAGSVRRKQDDYGYWYSPDGRDLQRQKEFEDGEAKPQAIEKAFCEVLEIPFQVSVDNLKLTDYDTSSFEKKVDEELKRLRREGFPKRAEQFLSKLQNVNNLSSKTVGSQHRL